MSRALPFWRRALLKVAGGVPATNQRGVFAGAQVNRLSSDFMSSVTGPRAELRYELRTLRSRARDLERNNAYARRYLNIVSENVVGPTGIRLQVQARRADGSLDAETNAQIENAFRAWSHRDSCTVTGRMSWVELQAAAIRGVARDGEAFIRLVDGAANPFGFALQLLDPDQFDETYNIPRKQQADVQTVMSIELDEWDRPVGYLLWAASPYDYDSGAKQRRERLPAAQIIHLFRQRRPGQVRGETWIAPVMMSLKQLDGFSEAALVNARISAAKMGWITQAGEDVVPMDGATSPIPMEAEPGLISRLAPGEDFKSWDSTYPSGEYSAFVNAHLHQIAAGLNVSHASMTGDLSQVNYSSGRMGRLPELDHWRTLQAWFSEAFCDVVYRRWLANATLRRMVSLPTERLSDYPAAWRARGWASIDPLKDIEANALAVAYGFTSRSRVVAEDGLDFGDILAELDAEHELMEEYEITLATPNGVTQPMEAPDGEAEDGGPDAEGTGDAVADGDRGSRGPRHARGGGRAHSDLHLLRVAGGAVVRA